MQFQFVPPAIELDEIGRRLPDRNDDWRMGSLTKDAIPFQNVRTYHVVNLGKDHVHHFASNPHRSSGGIKFGFLTLAMQVVMQGNDVCLIPTPRPGEAPLGIGRDVTERAVDVGYPDVSGLADRLRQQGWQLQWCSEERVARAELNGWERVVAEDGLGELISFRVKGRIADLILVKRRRD